MVGRFGSFFEAGESDRVFWVGSETSDEGAIFIKIADFEASVGETLGKS